MGFEKDFSLEEMSDAVECGAALAWRLLATLEGGSLLLATSALLAYTMTNKIVRQNRPRRNIRNVLVTNTTNLLGRELKRRLEMRGCIVQTVAHSSNVTDSAESEANLVNKTSSSLVPDRDKVDAIMVVGAEPKADGLDGMANLVTEDIFKNLRLLEAVSSRLDKGGYIAWACASDGNASTGAFSGASIAFDSVLHAHLVHMAKLRECEAIWVGRRTGVAEAAEHTVDCLLALPESGHGSRFSIRNTAHRLGECLGRWLKIVS